MTLKLWRQDLKMGGTLKSTVKRSARALWLPPNDAALSARSPHIEPGSSQDFHVRYTLVTRVHRA